MTTKIFIEDNLIPLEKHWWDLRARGRKPRVTPLFDGSYCVTIVRTDRDGRDRDIHFAEMPTPRSAVAAYVRSVNHAWHNSDHPNKWKNKTLAGDADLEFI